MILAIAEVLPGCAHPPTALATGDEGPASNSSTTGAGGGGGAGGGAGSANDGPALFAAIQDQMVSACGACHDVAITQS